MTEYLLRDGIRKNLIFAAIFVLLLAYTVYRYYESHGTSSPPPAQRSVASPAESPGPNAPVTDSADSPAQTAEIQATMATLAEHQKKLDDNPQSEDAPALLNAMGNLNFQRMGNYKEAARCYDLLITLHPDWPGIKPAYHQLATCFQRLGDRENEQRVYKTMMKVFPEDSQEYAYAKNQLGL